MPFSENIPINDINLEKWTPYIQGMGTDSFTLVLQVTRDMQKNITSATKYELSGIASLDYSFVEGLVGDIYLS